MFVKPKPGRVVPDPVRGDVLPPEGREVDPAQQYWQRRIADGDVAEAVSQEDTPATAGKKKES